MSNNFLIEYARGKIQARIAKLLASRSVLISLTTHSESNVRAEAEKLLVTQSAIENDLSKANAIFEKVRSGTYTGSDVIFLGDVALSIEQHIDNVDKLNEHAIGGKSQVESTIPWQKIGLLVGGAWLLKKFKVF